MPKQKSHKGLSKRIKITASGKVKGRRSFGGHLMSKKTAKRRRQIAKTTIIGGKMAKKMKAILA